MSRQSAIILCGITYLQIIDVACEGLTFEQSAEKLGVSAPYLREVLRKRSLLHWFPRKGGMPKGKRFPRGYKGISKGELFTAIAEHGSVTAAAVSLGIDRSTVYRRGYGI